MKNKSMLEAVKKASAGDAEAFGQIYATYEQQVYYLALRMTKNTADAGDVLQETMLSLYRSLGSLQDPGKLGSYVMRIAYNCSLKSMKGGPGDLAGDEVLEQIPDPDREGNPESHMESMERKKLIFDTIDSLSDGQRAVITLFYYQNYSVRQIAEVLGVSESVVKTRLSRGRESLRQSLVRHRNVVAAFLVILFLPRLLRVDAKAACTSALSEGCWGSLCTELGFSKAVAAQPPVIPGWANPFGGMPLAAKGAALLATGAVATTATVVFISAAGAGIPATAPAGAALPEPVLSAQEEVDAGAAATAVSFGTPMSLSEPDRSVDTETAVRESEPGVYVVDGREFYKPPERAPSKKPESSSKSQSGQGSGSDSGAADSAAGGVSEATGSGPDFLTAPDYVIYCSKGKSMSQGAILRSAGATLSRPADISVYHYDAVDFNQSGEYGLYLQAVDEKGIESHQVALIIIVS